MNLIYEITETGYTIFKDGKPWIKQESYIPYPGETMEESAQLHIEELLAQQEEQPALSEFEQLKTENMELKLAVAELAETLEAEKLNTQLALAELAETMIGGTA